MKRKIFLSVHFTNWKVLFPSTRKSIFWTTLIYVEFWRAEYICRKLLRMKVTFVNEKKNILSKYEYAKSGSEVGDSTFSKISPTLSLCNSWSWS